MTDSPGISSFVIRIIEEPVQNESAATYRGIIRHVQTDQEISFVEWSDVELFIQQFVPIQLMTQNKQSPPALADPGGVI
jgi:hypothetical protein